MMQGWGFTGRAGLPQRFEEQYHCYSVAYADKAHLEGGDKILLPPSAFDTLARLQVDYPMLFRLESPQKGTMTHCGVLEFTAEEGSCYVPFWVMQNLLVEEGAVITVTNVSLPKATFVKLRPQHVDFLDITNPRAVLEHALRNFSCVTRGDVICVPYNERNYHFELMEVRPPDAACIIETDCNVDFDAPVGYKDPSSDAKGESAAGGPGGSAPPSSSGSQSALAGLAKRSSACPSPTPSSMSGASGSVLGGGTGAAGVAGGAAGASAGAGDGDGSKPRGTRIVGGKIVRPDDDDGSARTSSSRSGGVGTVDPKSDALAPRAGATGVQPNAAVAVAAPDADYWAVAAGDGSRLDGRDPAPLRDRDGNELDVAAIRAEAAARRAAAASAAAGGSAASSSASAAAASSAAAAGGGDGDKKPAAAAAAPVVSKRKTRVGSRYSRLKKSGASAFGGSANNI